MNRIEQYNWNDCLAYLNHMIVRVNGHYAIIGDDPSSTYVFRFDTLDAAKKRVESLYVIDLVFNLLLQARDSQLITDDQVALLFGLVEHEYLEDAANLTKILQSSTSLWRSEVS